MNESSLRRELHRIGGALDTDTDRAAVALRAGRRRVAARRRAVRGVAVVTAGVAAFSWYGVTSARTTPASAAVSCYGDHVVVDHRHVTVTKAGLRLTVTNATADPVRFLAGDTGAILPPGRSAVEVPVHPGRVVVSCDSGAAVVPAAALTVVDRHRVFVDDSLDCARPDIRTAQGDIESGDPVALTRTRLGGDVPGAAVVEPAGYPTATPRRLVRVRVGAHIVGVAVWHEMPQPGTWALDTLRVCAPISPR